jgi:alginate O-acetyltransferase complex protein AlgI
MEIVSLNFAAYTVITAVIYHLLSRKYKSIWLLGISYLFYFLVDVRYALVLFILSSINYLLASWSQKSKSVRVLPNIAVALNLLSFLLLKWLSSRYSGSLFGVGNNPAGWLLPVGFSFYVLQLISFQIAIKKMKFTDLPPFGRFLLCFSYFPKLLSGPIEKPVLFLQKLDRPKLVDISVLGDAFGLIFIGLLRKVLIADGLTGMVSQNFKTDGNPSWLSILVYGIILYNDFAGYTSIVRGVSLFFGIELSPNFQQPYLARNISEFWSSWHISLTTWLRETIFFPLSRKIAKQKGFIYLLMNVCVPPLVTMLASGLWHGFSLGMLVWGAIYGVLLIIERLLYEIWPVLRPSRLNPMGQFVSWAITFFIVCMSWLPFSTITLKQSISAIIYLFINPTFSGHSQPGFPMVLILLSFVFDYLSQKFRSEFWWRYLSQPLRTIGLAVCLFMLAAAFIYHLHSPVDIFIYQGF